MVAEAEALQGRWLIYPLPGPGRTKVPTWGRIEYLGEQQYPRYLRVHYPGGLQDDITLRLVRKYLQGVNSTPPRDILQAVSSPVTNTAAAALVSSTVPTFDSINGRCLVAPGVFSLADLRCLAQVVDLLSAAVVCDPLGGMAARAFLGLFSKLHRSAVLPAFSSSHQASSVHSMQPIPSAPVAADIAVCAL